MRVRFPSPLDITSYAFLAASYQPLCWRAGLENERLALFSESCRGLKPMPQLLSLVHSPISKLLEFSVETQISTRFLLSFQVSKILRNKCTSETPLCNITLTHVDHLVGWSQSFNQCAFRERAIARGKKTIHLVFRTIYYRLTLLPL